MPETDAGAFHINFPSPTHWFRSRFAARPRNRNSIGKNVSKKYIRLKHENCEKNDRGRIEIDRMHIEKI